MPDSPDSYEMNIGQAEELGHKTAVNLNQRELEAEDERHRPQFNGGRLRRGWQAIRFGASREGIRHGISKQTKEYRRITGNERIRNELSAANRGAAATTTPDVIARVTEMREQHNAIVEEHKLLRDSGAPGLTALAGDFIEITDPAVKTNMLDTVLRPAVAALKAATTDQQRFEAQSHIQQNLTEFVQRHQGNADVTRIFGRNNNRYGDPAEFFATDVAGLAQKIINDGKADELAAKAIDDAIKIKIFNMRQGQSTEVNGNWADHIYARLKQNRVGRHINAASIGVLSVVGTLAVKSIAKRGVTFTTGVAAPVAGVVTSMVYKNFQERHLINQELRAVGRDLESSLEAGDNSPRRTEIEALLNPVFARSSDLLHGRGNDASGSPRTSSIEDLLSTAIVATGGETAEQLRDMNRARAEILRRYGEMEARRTLPQVVQGRRGPLREIGMIRFDTQESSSHPTIRHVDTGRLQFDLAMVQLRRKLNEAGLTDEANRSATEWRNRLLQTREQQQRDFVRYRELRAFRKAMGAGAIGALTALGSQEGIALIARGAGKDTKATVLEKTIGKLRQGIAQTPIDNGTHAVGERMGRIPGLINDSAVADYTRSAVGTLRLNNPRGWVEDNTPIDEWTGAVKEKISHIDLAPQDSHKGMADQIKGLFGKNGDVKVGNDLILHADSSNGVNTLIGFKNGQGHDMDFPRFSLINNNGHLIIQGNQSDVDQLLNQHQNIKDALTAAGWNHQILDDPNYNFSHKLDILSQANTQESGHLGRIAYDFNPSGTATNQSGIDVLTMKIDFTDPASGQHIVGRDMIFGYDRTTHQLIMDPYNPQNVQWGVKDTDIQFFNQEAAKDGFQFKLLKGAGLREVDSRVPVLGSNGVWDQHTTAATTEYYGNNTKVSDFNELLLKNRKDGDAIVFGNREMMLSWQKGLDPYEINVQKITKDGKAVWGFEIPGHGKIFVPDGADGLIDGELRIDPNDYIHEFDTPGGKMKLGDLARVMLKPQEYGHLQDKSDFASEYYKNFMGEDRTKWLHLGGPEGANGFATVGMWATDNSGNPIIDNAGNHVYKQFAATLATGATPETLGDKIKQTYDIWGSEVIPQAVEFTPPGGTDAWEAPLIPIPFFPRHDLESPLFKEGYYLMGGGLSEERKREFEKRLSKTLKKNPKAKLNPRKEETDYLDKQDSKYKKEVDKLAAQIVEPISDNLKAIVCIPVAGHQEGKNIYKSLESYLKQDAPKDQFEILLLVNYPEKDKEGKKVAPDNTMEEIERFKKDHPDLPVRVITKILQPQEANIGMIRKYLNDVAITRQLNSKNGDRDVILISNDADNKGIAPTYIKNFIEKFEADPTVDGMLGQLDWDPEAYTKYPLVHIGTRLFQYLNLIGRNRTGRMSSSGANFAFRGSMYAAIGGYIPGIDGEDIAIGQAIVAARGEPDALKFAGARVSRVYTSARRAIKALEKGIPPIDQWKQQFSVLNDEVRDIIEGSGEDIDYNDPAQVIKLKNGLEQVINATIDLYESGETLGKNAPYYKQALRYLGVNYEVKNNKIEILNIDDVTRRLKHYQQIGVLLRDIKAGKGTPAMEAELTRLQQEFHDDLARKDEEEAREAKRKDDEVTKKLMDFEKSPLNLPDAGDPVYTLADLKSSASTETYGDYVVCLDKPLGSGRVGKVVAGYNKNTGEVFVFKQVLKADQEHIATANKYPKGVVDVEDIIKKDVHSPYLQLSTDIIDRGNNVLKAFPIAPTDLDKYLESHGPMDPKKATDLLIRVLSGVRDLHKRGILHLDLSPTNIILNKDNVQLTDFDAASIKKGARAEYKRGLGGGFRWVMPPEMFEENPTLTETADTYEAAVLLYKLLTNDYPYFSGDGTDSEKTEELRKAHLRGNPSIPNTLPEPIKNILRHGIQSDPNNRYQSVNDMLTDLLAANKAL